MKQNKSKSIMNKLASGHDQNKYLIELALAKGEFKTKEDLDEWYRCACFAKTLNPKFTDEELMPVTLREIMLKGGLIASSDYYIYNKLPEQNDPPL